MCNQGNCVRCLISNDSTELHLSVFRAETICSEKISITILDTLKLLYFVKKISEHRYAIRISESCVDQNPSIVERHDPDNFTCFQTWERCPMEIAAYVFKLTIYIEHLHCSVRFIISNTALNFSVIIHYRQRSTFVFKN